MADRSDLPTRFFKVILPTIADQQKLKLPDKYVKEFGHRLSDVVRLTDRIGGIWHVRLEKEEEIIWLHHGWEKFYEDHSIKYGYFVLFKYRGNSNFKIHVFDMTATEVHYPAHNSRNFEVTNYHPENSIPERKEESDDDSLVILDSLPPKLVACSDLEQMNYHHGNSILERKEESDDDSLLILDSLPPKLVGCSLRNPTPCRSALVARHDKRGKKAVNAAGISTLTYPSFTVEMKANLKPQWVVYVPAQFAKDYLPKSPKYIELQDSDGKKWKVRVNLRPNYHTVRALSTGWANFAKAKKIEVGDTCVFEIIPGNKPALKVSIYHNTGRVPRLL